MEEVEVDDPVALDVDAADDLLLDPQARRTAAPAPVSIVSARRLLSTFSRADPSWSFSISQGCRTHRCST
jgi:hypothetical protein